MGTFEAEASAEEGAVEEAVASTSRCIKPMMLHRKQVLVKILRRNNSNRCYD